MQRVDMKKPETQLIEVTAPEREILAAFGPGPRVDPDDPRSIKEWEAWWKRNEARRRDVGALTHSNRKTRVNLPCGSCGRRIAWWSLELRHGLAGLDGIFRGWKWQGDRPVLRFGSDGTIVDVDWQGRRPIVRIVHDLAEIACQSCLAVRIARQPYPFWWRTPPEIL
jgi:hypothetical protein